MRLIGHHLIDMTDEAGYLRAISKHSASFSARPRPHRRDEGDAGL
jgi:hypothetical protein